MLVCVTCTVLWPVMLRGDASDDPSYLHCLTTVISFIIWGILSQMIINISWINKILPWSNLASNISIWHLDMLGENSHDVRGTKTLPDNFSDKKNHIRQTWTTRSFQSESIKLSFTRRNVQSIKIFWLWCSSSSSHKSGLILGLRPANKRHRYKVKLSLTGWAQSAL